MATAELAPVPQLKLTAISDTEEKSRVHKLFMVLGIMEYDKVAAQTSINCFVVSRVLLNGYRESQKADLRRPTI